MRYHKEAKSVMSLTEYGISTEELAYIAGFFDGEGCITSGGRRCSLAISASNTDKQPLEFIQRIFGGSIYECLPKKLKWSTVYNWRIGGAYALIVLESLLPYLIVKRRQALLGIELIKSSDIGRQASIVTELRMLKSRYKVNN